MVYLNNKYFCLFIFSRSYNNFDLDITYSVSYRRTLLLLITSI